MQIPYIIVESTYTANSSKLFKKYFLNFRNIFLDQILGNFSQNKKIYFAEKNFRPFYKKLYLNLRNGRQFS